MQGAAALPFNTRKVVYSFLRTEEIVYMASTLCKLDRKMIPYNQAADRVAIIDLGKIENLGSLLSLPQDYFWSLVTEIKFTANNIIPQEVKPDELAQFFISLPASFTNKVSLSINSDNRNEIKTRKGNLETFFYHLYTKKSTFTFKNLKINTDDEIEAESRISSDSFSNFFNSETLDVRKVKILDQGKGLNHSVTGIA